jgi:thiol:disulfide interchange protein DsbD
MARVMGSACLISAIVLGGVRGESSDASTADGRDGVVTWSADALASLQAQGLPVFVDVTADWCLTCLAPEQAVLFTDEITQAFAASEVTYMVADWTNYDPGIGEFVRQHGRNGIPLYVMYSGNPQVAPVILPQLLTTRMVMEALDAVTR